MQVLISAHDPQLKHQILYGSLDGGSAKCCIYGFIIVLHKPKGHQTSRCFKTELQVICSNQSMRIGYTSNKIVLVRNIVYSMLYISVLHTV